MKRILIYISFLTLFFACKKTANNGDEPCVGWCQSTTTSIIDYQAAWSPDGESIAYYHVDSDVKKCGIYIIKKDGTENRLWHSGVNAENPTWSPDGTWLAFSENAQIWKKQINGSNITQLTSLGRNFFPSWSPDGNRIAYTQTICNEIKSCGVWFFDINTKQETFLADYGGFPIWQNADELLFFKRIIKSNVAIGDSLIRYSFNKNMFANLLFAQGRNSYLKVNTNSKLLFTSQIATEQDNGVPQIWTRNIDGNNLKQLTQNQGYTADWSPDANQIVYTHAVALNGRLWIMNGDGTESKQLTFKEIF